MSNINPGYMGYASVGGTILRFESANVVVKQEVEAPDLIMGDWDHDAWNYGKISVGGSVSGPVTESFAAGSASIWSWATTRSGTCGTLAEKDVTFYYFCGGTTGRNSRTFTGMLCNSLNISCAAGDIAKFSIDVMAAGAGPWGGYGTPVFTPEKLVTWDKVSVAVTGTAAPTGILAYSNFDFTISNNVTPQYSLGQGNLFPYEMVPGLRTITGTLSAYNVPTSDGADTWDSYLAADVATITFSIGGAPQSFKVRFHRVEPASATGPIISTLAFTGVTHQSGL